MLWLRQRLAATKLSCLHRRFISTKSIHPIVLRPYQQYCLDACTESLSAGVSRLGVSLPTGSGKTTVFISLLARISPPPENPQATRSLIIVNSVELARQAASQVLALFPHWHVEIEQGSRYKASGLADVTIATYQTLLQSQRISKFDPARLKAIIVDEAHHAAAPSYRRLLSRFHRDVQNPDPDHKTQTIPPHIIPIVGFSATFSRHDGLALGSVFERIVYHRDFLEMIKEQWLCNVRFTSVKADINLKNVTVNSRAGDFNATSLAHIINTSIMNQLVVQAWLDRAATRRSTLVFCVNLAHVRELTASFRTFGVDARYIYSGTPAAERNVLLNSFKKGEYPVLVNCAILTEGTDIPNIDCVVVARPTRSRNVFAQMIGRGMRLSPETGKEDCLIIDFVESISRVPSIACSATLFGLDPSEIIEGQTTEELEKRAQLVMQGELMSNHPPFNSNVDMPAPESVTYTDYDDPYVLVHNASGAPHVAKMSNNAWVGCGEDIYVLECLGKGYIRIEPVEEDKDNRHFRAFYVPAMPPKQTARSSSISPFLRSRKILDAQDLSDAIRGCDTYATRKVVPGPMAMGITRSAHWRSNAATENQRSYISKRLKNKIVQSKTIKLDTLTKGEAANIISRLKHGAQARYDKKARESLKLQKRLAEISLRKATEVVKEGPL